MTPMGTERNFEGTRGVAARAVTVRVSRQFSAPAERVFDAWLDPLTARAFLFATDKSELPRPEIDARVGGRFRFLRREAATEVALAGEYLEIDRPHLLVFSLEVGEHAAADDRVIIELAPIERGSLLVLTHEMSLHKHAERYRLQSEWTVRLGMLASICASQPATTLSIRDVLTMAGTAV